MGGTLRAMGDEANISIFSNWNASAELLSRLGIESVSDVRHGRLRWFGHVELLSVCGNSQPVSA